MRISAEHLHKRLITLGLHTGLATLLVLQTGMVPAQTQTSMQDRLRAHYLHQFARFVTWPDERAGEPLRIGLYGSGMLHAAEEELHDRRLRGRRMEVVRLDPADSWPDNCCDMVYVPLAESGNSIAGKGFPEDRTMLLVTEHGGGQSTGSSGVINLVRHGGRLRFEVNLERARRHGFSISSELLKSAIKVYSDR